MIFYIKDKKNIYMDIIYTFFFSIQFLTPLFIQAAIANDFSTHYKNKAQSATLDYAITEKIEINEVNDKKASFELKKLKTDEMLAKPFLEPKLAFVTGGNEEVAMKSYRGNLVILYFFASWCTSCSKDVQSLAKLSDKIKFADIEDVKIILSSQDFKSAEQVYQSFGSTDTKNLNVVFDKNLLNMSLLGIKSMPTALLINKQGFVFARIERNLEWSSKDVFDDIIALKDKQPIEIDAKNVYSFDNSEDIIYKKGGKKPITIIN